MRFRLIAVAAAVVMLTACGSTTTTKTVTVALPASAPLSATAYTVFPPNPPGSCKAGGVLPDPTCTPGALNPQVTQATIGTTICVPGWTSTIRPPSSITGAEKTASMAAYSVTGPGNFEYDHLISLELGGAANDNNNLWPEAHLVATPKGALGSLVKDGVENSLKKAICSGHTTLALAQYWIAHDWTVAIPLVKDPTAPLPAIPAPGPTPVTPPATLPGCQQYPGRIYFHHVKQNHCAANYFLTP